nr:MAG TPA: hypothetical protein [Caudoviricetes sp.]
MNFINNNADLRQSDKIFLILCTCNFSNIVHNGSINKRQ